MARDNFKTFVARRGSAKETLRRILKKILKHREDFDLEKKDDVFEGLDKQVGAEIDYLIAGHTHLHRAIKRKSNKYYFNCGTWIRLIRLSDALLEREQFDRVYEAFEAGTLQALDDLKGLGPKLENLIMRRSTVASIVNNEGNVSGQLFDVREDGSLEPIEGSQLP